MFIAMKPASWKKPGYTSRMKPALGSGTLWMQLRLNQAIPRFSASLLTSVRLTRVSIGPPISVIDRGVCGLLVASMRAMAAITGTEGWQTAMTCTSGPSSCSMPMT